MSNSYIDQLKISDPVEFNIRLKNVVKEYVEDSLFLIASLKTHNDRPIKFINKNLIYNGAFEQKLKDIIETMTNGLMTTAERFREVILQYHHMKKLELAEEYNDLWNDVKTHFPLFLVLDFDSYNDFVELYINRLSLLQ